MAEARHAEAGRIGRLIATLRERKGWNQEDLAHEIGVSTSTISRWERGLHQGYGPNVRKLADILDVEPGTLLPADEVLVGSQLDRIERRLDEIYTLLTGDPADSAEPGVGGLADRLLSAGESPPRKAGGRPATRRAGRQRTVA